MIKIEKRIFTREKYIKYLKKQERISFLAFIINVIWTISILSSPNPDARIFAVIPGFLTILFMVVGLFENHRIFLIKYMCAATVFQEDHKLIWRKRK